jgi:hypothetical protein
LVLGFCVWFFVIGPKPPIPNPQSPIPKFVQINNE